MAESEPVPFRSERVTRAATDAAHDLTERLGRLAGVVSDAATWLGRAANGLLLLCLAAGAVTWSLVVLGFRDRSWWGLAAALVVAAAVLIPAGAAWVVRWRTRVALRATRDLTGDIARLQHGVDVQAFLADFFSAPHAREGHGPHVPQGMRGALRTTRTLRALRGHVVGGLGTLAELRATMLTLGTLPGLLLVSVAGLAVLGLVSLVSLVAWIV